MATNAHPSKDKSHLLKQRSHPGTASKHPSKQAKPPRKPDGREGFRTDAGAGLQAQKLWNERDNPDLSQRVTHGGETLWKLKP